MSLLASAPTGDRSREAIRRLVAAGREKFFLDLRGDGSAFDAPCWDIAGWKDRSVSRTNRRVYFTRHGTRDQALPSAYADVVKS